MTAEALPYPKRPPPLAGRPERLAERERLLRVWDEIGRFVERELDREAQRMKGEPQ